MKEIHNTLYNKSLDQLDLLVFLNQSKENKDGSDQNTKEIDFIVEEKATGEFFGCRCWY